MSIPRQKKTNFFGELNGKHISIARCLRVEKVSLFGMRDASIDVKVSRTGNKDLYSCFFRIVPPSEKEVCRPLPRNERSSLSSLLPTPADRAFMLSPSLPPPPSPPPSEEWVGVIKDHEIESSSAPSLPPLSLSFHQDFLYSGEQRWIRQVSFL